MKTFLVEVLVNEAKYQLLKELNVCKHISFTVLVARYGRDVLDNLCAKNLIIRHFVKRGTVINSFLKLTSTGKKVIDTALVVRGEQHGSTEM